MQVRNCERFVLTIKVNDPIAVKIGVGSIVVKIVTFENLNVHYHYNFDHNRAYFNFDCNGIVYLITWLHCFLRD